MQLIAKVPGSVGKQEAGGSQPPEEKTAKGVSGKQRWELWEPADPHHLFILLRKVQQQCTGGPALSASHKS